MYRDSTATHGLYVLPSGISLKFQELDKDYEKLKTAILKRKRSFKSKGIWNPNYSKKRKNMFVS